jgi:hypothetical protein
MAPEREPFSVVPCPPHHWLITGLDRRGQHWNCLRCDAQRDLEPQRTHLSAHWQAKAAASKTHPVSHQL